MCFVCFVWFDSLRPINNLSVKQGRVFLGWTSTKLGLMCLAQGPQRSDAGEAQAYGLSFSSQAFYHWATALPVKCNVNDIIMGLNQYLQEINYFCILHDYLANLNCWSTTLTALITYF